MKILYVGPDYPGSNATCWRNAFQRIGHSVVTLNAERLIPEGRGLEKAMRKLSGKPSIGHINRLNEAVVSKANELRPDLTFYAQARFILPETLAVAGSHGPNVVYMNDDMFNVRNQTHTFTASVPYMDCILTTKSYNVPEFLRAGGRYVMFLPNAYDPAIHFPAKPSDREREHLSGDLAFIGTFRCERADYLASLQMRLRGRQLSIWGGGWNKMSRLSFAHKWQRWRPLRPCIRGAELWCTAMGKAIQCNKITLGLLNHANRDLHTSRTFEIPACGGFMLAERTAEHMEYFEEDTEAVYFGDIDELCDKATYYLDHPRARERIALSGYQRCISAGYTYVDRAKKVLAIVQVLRPLARHLSTN